MSRLCRHRRRRRGVTLIELILALGLITLVSMMMFAFFDLTLKIRENTSRVMADSHLLRVVANRIADEVRACNGFVSSVGPGISGEERMLAIQAVGLPGKHLFLRQSITDPPLPAECDIRQIEYYLAYDEEETFGYPDGTESWKPLGLVRRETKTLYQTTTLEIEEESVDLDLFAPEVKYLRLRYFDGVDWIDTWDVGTGGGASLGNSLPQAVEITVGYTPLPPEEEEDIDLEDDDLSPAPPEPYSPETYTVAVRLHQADSFLGSRLMRAQRSTRSGSRGQ